MLCLHYYRRVFGAEEVAGIVDGGHKVKIFFFHFSHGAGAYHSRVGEHQVEAAEALHGLRDHIGHGFLIGHVHGNRKGPFAHFSGYLPGKGLVQIRYDYRGALVVKLLRYAPAKALGRAGHYAYLSRHTAASGRAYVGVRPCHVLPFCHIYRHFLLLLSI